MIAHRTRTGSVLAIFLALALFIDAGSAEASSASSGEASHVSDGWTYGNPEGRESGATSRTHGQALDAADPGYPSLVSPALPDSTNTAPRAWASATRMSPPPEVDDWAVSGPRQPADLSALSVGLAAMTAVVSVMSFLCLLHVCWRLWRLTPLSRARGNGPVAPASEENHLAGASAARFLPSETATDGTARRSACRPRPARIPCVRFLAGVIDRLVEGIQDSRQQRGNVETGFALVGKVTRQDGGRVITVTGLIDEGPNADRSGAYHKADRDYQQRELELLQLADGDVMYLGDAHLHPGRLDTCSAGDYRTDLANVRESRTRELVFVIATVGSGALRGRSDSSVYRGGLKLDFFYLGESSGYEYQQCKPEVVEGEALSIPPLLRQFTEADPVRTRLDFENLRRLAAYEMVLADAGLGDENTPHLCVEMRHRALGFRTLIVFEANPFERPDVYVDTGEDVLSYRPEGFDSGRPGLVWFTPIVLEVEREVTARCGLDKEIDTGSPVGDRSAPAEVRT